MDFVRTSQSVEHGQYQPPNQVLAKLVRTFEQCARIVKLWMEQGQFQVFQTVQQTLDVPLRKSNPKS